jgi:hypothetical protein
MCGCWLLLFPWICNLLTVVQFEQFENVWYKVVGIYLPLPDNTWILLVINEQQSMFSLLWRPPIWFIKLLKCLCWTSVMYWLLSNCMFSMLCIGCYVQYVMYWLLCSVCSVLAAFMLHTETVDCQSFCWMCYILMLSVLLIFWLNISLDAVWSLNNSTGVMNRIWVGRPGIPGSVSGWRNLFFLECPV